MNDACCGPIIQYDENYENVIKWGAIVPSGRNEDSNKQPKLIELSKGVPEEEKLKLPEKLTLIKAITDYFREMGNFLCFFCSEVYIFLFR